MIKRLFDVVVSAVMLIVLSPVLAITAFLVRFKIGTPVFFVQTRPGLKGHPFALIKFRTMQDAYDIDGRPAPDEERLTSFGKALRASSLDELPELWNVLRGDMSLVGPRPLLMQYLSRYTPEQARRHQVRPGITGWAQVNGRNALSWDQKFALDLWYINHRSLALDLRILLITVGRLFSRRGIAADGHATAPEFLGSCKESANGSSITDR
ncbi:MAG: sugar transferase [Terriglobia bacterium]|nr:sugar transferase [Terriglobia bacterium]